jgi:hypothetical protein
VTAQLSLEQTREIVERVEKGERVSVVGIDFGLLDTEVREIVARVRTARASRAGRRATPQPAPAVASPVARQEPAPQAPAGGPDAARAGGPPPAGTASRVGRLLTTGSPVGEVSTVPAKRIADVSQYLEHPDRKVAKAAAAAHKALGILANLAFVWEAAEAERQRQERERTEAAAAVARLEQELAEARDKLRAARGTAKPSSPNGRPPTTGAKRVRAWAAENGVPCPPVGRVPRGVQDAYDRAHQEASA